MRFCRLSLRREDVLGIGGLVVYLFRRYITFCKECRLYSSRLYSSTTVSLETYPLPKIQFPDTIFIKMKLESQSWAAGTEIEQHHVVSLEILPKTAPRINPTQERGQNSWDTKRLLKRIESIAIAILFSLHSEVLIVPLVALHHR